MKHFLHISAIAAWITLGGMFRGTPVWWVVLLVGLIAIYRPVMSYFPKKGA